MGARRRKLKDPLPLGQLLRQSYPGRTPDDFRLTQACRLWSRSFPHRVVAHARPARLNGNVLWVHVASHAWANEMEFLKTRAASVLRGVLGSGVKLRFTVAPLPPLPDRRPVRPRTPSPVRWAQIPDDVAAALSTVRDDSLRKCICAAARTGLALLEAHDPSNR